MILDIGYRAQPVQDKQIRKTRDGRQFIGNSSKAMKYKKELSQLFWYSMYLQKQKKIGGLLKVDYIFIFQLPQSANAGEKKAVENGALLYKDTAPDLDNLIKGTQDALNAVAFADDRKIVKHTASKFYGKCDRIIVRIEQIKEAGEHEAHLFD